MTTVREVASYLESLAPLDLQESYDNAGLLVGDESMEVSGVLLCLDCTEEIIDEALKHHCNLVIAHHPLIFSGLKKLNGDNYVERTVIKAIRKNVAVYAAHTNLDNIHIGVNARICEKLGLKNGRILSPKKNLLKKIVTFCPLEHADNVRNALFNAGSGAIGNYDECSFNMEGTGTFRGGENTNPFVGEKGIQHREKEIRMELIFESRLEAKVIQALLLAHPYEEVAYDIYPLHNAYSRVGSGMIGDFETPMDARVFLNHVKSTMKTGVIRHTTLPENKISRVAVCGGAGSFLLADAIRHGAHAFITADFKYHQFFDADGKIMIADIGHYESEQFTIELFHELLVKKFSTFAIRLPEVVTNPVNYF